MWIQCRGCAAKLSWNHKADPKLAEIACPYCGAGFKRAQRERDPLARRESIVHQFRGAVNRLETVVRELRNVPELVDTVESSLRDLAGSLGGGRVYAIEAEGGRRE